jgi:hypothetical protein
MEEITPQRHPKIRFILSTIKRANKEIPCPAPPDSPQLLIAKPAAKIGHIFPLVEVTVSEFPSCTHSAMYAQAGSLLRSACAGVFYVKFYFVGFLYMIGTETFFTVKNPVVIARHRSCSYLFYQI